MIEKLTTFITFVLPADLCSMNNGSDFKWAKDPEERSHLWKARHDILYACMALKPGSKVGDCQILDRLVFYKYFLSFCH